MSAGLLLTQVQAVSDGSASGGDGHRYPATLGYNRLADARTDEELVS